MSDFIGLGISYAFIVAVMIVANLLLLSSVLKAGPARKLIHVSVGHWWFIAMALISNPWAALAGPVSFIAVNYIIQKRHLLKAMENDGSNMGTVYYPVSLLILVLACWFGDVPRWVGSIGVMILAWGDGMAAVIGEAFSGPRGKFRIFGNTKSYMGSGAMFVISAVAVQGLQMVFTDMPFEAAVVPSLIIAAAATAAELLTPWGLDNISVPLLSVALYYLAFI